MDTALPKEFFTIEAMGTLAGVTAATLVIVNGCQRAFNFNPAWFGLAVAEMICLTWVFVSGGVGSDWFIAVINGFLVYAAAGGVTGAGASVTGSTVVAKGARPGARTQRRFFSPWWS